MAPGKRKKVDDDDLDIYCGTARVGSTVIQRKSTARVVTFEETDGRMSGRQQYVDNLVEISIPQDPLPDAVPPPSALDMPTLGGIDDEDDDFMYSPPTVDDTYATNESSNETPADPVEKKRVRIKALFDWMPYRQSYGDEIVRRDGRADFMDDMLCCDCRKAPAELRCSDCTGDWVLCGECMLVSHSYLPLHRIKRWYNGYWAHCSLYELGLVFQLGHNGGICPAPMCLIPVTYVMDVNGPHNVAVQVCRCGDIPPDDREPRNQFLRMGWFPASPHRPQTAFTFALLDLFHELSVQGKISAHDFYHGIVHQSDNAGILGTQKRYDEFLRITRYHRHLMLLKRAGRIHDPSGIDTTTNGQLALDCPSCPLPGKNLPASWEDAPLDERWLYGLTLAIDANFRLKRKERGVVDDPELGPGWAYFVEDSAYKAELDNYQDEVETNTCESTFQAIEQATSKAKDGYSVTGVGAVICARSGILRPNGVGDLQRGERYRNMDFIFLSSLIGTMVTWVLVSYDISCQWSKNLRSRVAAFPTALQHAFLMITTLRFAVPKFHLPAHGDACQSVFSLNYLPYTARTDGEGIERGWSHINPVAMSTREMGPGFRHDTLDVHWSALNWRKTVGLGTSLQRKFTEAVKYAELQAAQFKEMTEAFDSGLVDMWRTVLEDWLARPTLDKEDPFREPSSSKSIADVRAELAREECPTGTIRTQPLHDASPSAMLLRGLELEELQRSVASMIVSSKSKPGSVEAAVLEEKRTALARKIKRWRVVQTAYMPCVAELLLQRNTSHSPESDPLHLPSALSPSNRTSLPSAHGLVEKELRIRLAQAEDGIASVKRILCLRYRTYGFQSTNLVGQRDGTRACSLLQSLEEKLESSVARYRVARSALLVLNKDGDWKTRYEPLDDADLTNPSGDTDSNTTGSMPPTSNRVLQKKRTSEGRRTQSWIWHMRNIGVNNANDPEIDRGLRAEWAKAYARAEHWKEEKLLLREEMRRTLEYSSYKRRWWADQADRRINVTPAVADGLRAYSEKQAHLWSSLGMKFGQLWHGLLTKEGVGFDDWPAEFRPVQVQAPVDHNTPSSPSQMESSSLPQNPLDVSQNQQ